MNYEQKYKETLDLARTFYEGYIIQGHNGEAGILAEIFPELSESEDERIRKAIIALIEFGLEDKSAIAPGYNVIKEDAIAWLEKQGEQKPKHRYTFNSIPRLLDMIEPTDRAKSYCQKLIDSLLQEGYAADAKIVSDCLKQMNGEKVAMATMDEHADKVEPKFKVGDWVLSNNVNIYQVVKIRDNRYELHGQRGEIMSVPTNFTYGLRLWTIQDAKDGDVLLEEETGEPFIYNGNRATYFSGYFLGSYCGISNGEFNLYGNMHYWGKNSCPATKKQRDLLFQKMEEAGYEWDADKKELKKI